MSLRSLLDRLGTRLEKSKLRALKPLYEAFDTFLYTPGTTTSGQTHVRDFIDLKRIMTVVVIAVCPALLFGIYNVGHQAHLAIQNGATPLDAWQTNLFLWLGGQTEVDFLNDVLHGLCWFLPIFIVGFATGGVIEVAFACIRKHEVNEGFLVTGFLFPLILPATIPLWQVVLGVAFGVIFGKELFGGTGMNFMNPALCGRAFLFFAYPSYMTGNVWTVAQFPADGISGATWLHHAASGANEVPVLKAFLGDIPGAIGETSTLCCLIGAVILIATQIASWRTMLGIVLGAAITAFSFKNFGSGEGAAALSFTEHAVLGGFAFGAVFMATDPVSSPISAVGQLIYGICIGVMTLVIRVFNPAYPEGMMLAILLMNAFAPLIDHIIVALHTAKRRRHAI